MVNIGPEGPGGHNLEPDPAIDTGEENAPAAIVGRVARFGAWNMLAYVVQAGAALVINIVVGRALGPVGFGEYSFHVWIIRTLAWLLVLGVPPAMGRRISESEGSGDLGGVRAFYRHSFRIMGLAMPLLLASTALWTGIKAGDVFVGLSLGVAAVALSLVWGFEQALGGSRKYKRIAHVALIVSSAQLLTVFALYLTDPGLEEFLYLYAGIAVFTFGSWGIITHLNMRRLSRRELSGDEKKSFTKLAVAMAGVTLSDTFLWGRPEIYFLERYSDDRAVGFYAAALVLWTLTVYPPWIAARVLTPEFAWLRGGGKDEDLRRGFAAVCTYIALVSLPLGIGGSILAGDLLLIAYGEAYLPASLAASILLAGSALAAIMGPASAAAITGPKPGFAAKVSFSMAIANLGLDFLLIPRFGLVGASIATITSQCTAVLVVVAWVRVKMGLSYPWGRIVKVAIASAGAVALARWSTLGMGSRTLAVLIDIPVAGVIYIVSIMGMRVVTRQDVARVMKRQV